MFKDVPLITIHNNKFTISISLENQFLMKFL